jgi:hypothetical protein
LQKCTINTVRNTIVHESGRCALGSRVWFRIVDWPRMCGHAGASPTTNKARARYWLSGAIGAGVRFQFPDSRRVGNTHLLLAPISTSASRAHAGRGHRMTGVLEPSCRIQFGGTLADAREISPMLFDASGCVVCVCTTSVFPIESVVLARSWHPVGMI